MKKFRHNSDAQHGPMKVGYDVVWLFVRCDYAHDMWSLKLIQIVRIVL